MCLWLLQFFGCHPLNDNHKESFDNALYLIITFQKTFEGVACRDRRSCTNVVWFFLFILFLIGELYIGFYSIKVGNVLRFFYAVDSYGNRCGMDNFPFNVTFKEQQITFPSSGMKFSNTPYAFPLDVHRPFETLWICIRSCPDTTFHNVESLVNYLANTSKNNRLCDVNIDIDSNEKLEAYKFSNTGPCPRPPVYKSKSVLNRCLPEEIQHLPSQSIENLKHFMDSEDYFRQLFIDFYNARYALAVAVCISFVVSSCITYAMIWNNTRIVYVFYVTTMPCGLVCSIILISAFFYNFVKSFFLETKYLGLDAHIERFINGHRVDYVTLFWLSIIVIIFTLISWIITWTIFKPRRNLVSELFFQARKPLRYMLWLVPETFLNCCFSLILLVLWLYILLNLFSVEEPLWHVINTYEKRNNSQLSAISAIRIRYPDWINFALVYHAFSLLWIKSFLSDAQKIFVAEATSSWYFGENRRTSWQVIYFRSLYYLFRYHLGTVAFGSLLLLCVRIPSHIYLFIYYRIAKSKRPLIVWFYNRFFPWLSEVERLLRYIHSNAYAIVGANGEDFLASCKTATNLWMDNSWNLLTTNTVARLLFIMTKCAFSLIVGFLAGLYFRLDSNIEYWVAPALFSAVLAYFIMNRFMALHEMIIETMFLCYASEIDGFGCQRRIAAIGLPKKVDYGFNYYMARRIYEERHLNNSFD